MRQMGSYKGMYGKRAYIIQVHNKQAPVNVLINDKAHKRI